MYKVTFTEQADEDLARLKRSEPQAYKKAQRLLLELIDHPREGTGKVKELKYGLKGLWSRRITDKHRLFYEIQDEVISVVVVQAWGHDYTGE